MLDCDESSGSKAATAEKCKSHLELGITLAIFLWPSLTLAVNSAWGGPDSSAKREWFASSTIDLIAENPEADAEWVEEFLLNVLLDEFELNLEDDSAYEVAETIIRLRKNCMHGDWAEVLHMKEKWDAKNHGPSGEVSGFLRGEDKDAETSGSEDGDDEEQDTHVDKTVASPVVKAKEPLVVDEDGFITVTNKRR